MLDNLLSSLAGVNTLDQASIQRMKEVMVGVYDDLRELRRQSTIGAAS